MTEICAPKIPINSSSIVSLNNFCNSVASGILAGSTGVCDGVGVNAMAVTVCSSDSIVATNIVILFYIGTALGSVGGRGQTFIGAGRYENRIREYD